MNMSLSQTKSSIANDIYELGINSLTEGCTGECTIIVNNEEEDERVWKWIRYEINRNENQSIEENGNWNIKENKKTDQQFSEECEHRRIFTLKMNKRLEVIKGPRISI